MGNDSHRKGQLPPTWSDGAKATTLGYTTDDDCVHVTCDWCGHDDNLGFNASVYDAVLANALHAGVCDGGKD